MKEKNKKITKFKLVIDKKLFKSFNDQIITCVRDICFQINDKLCEKYTKYCNDVACDPYSNHEKFTCEKCWIIFLTKDLVKIQENNHE